MFLDFLGRVEAVATDPSFPDGPPRRAGCRLPGAEPDPQHSHPDGAVQTGPEGRLRPLGADAEHRLAELALEHRDRRVWAQATADGRIIGVDLAFRAGAEHARVPAVHLGNGARHEVAAICR